MAAIPHSNVLLDTTRIIHPDTNACSACDPPYQHRREWTSSPGDTPERPRTLVLCFDGTGESFDQYNSNVVRFLSTLKKDDPTKQLVYYQAGIGTYTGHGVVAIPILQRVSRLLDEMIAWNLPKHVKDGYRFLMQNYHAGDHICIFGFSRGAFTARALAGMLQKVGLLPPCNSEQLPFAYSMFARDDKEGLKLSMQFKRAFSVDVKIQFLGVWDTVQSVGVIPKHLPFSGANNAVVNFRHALALDERRVKFMPSFCTTPVRSMVEETCGTDSSRRSSEASHDYETQVNALSGPDTNVEEVFFAGAHCDVGGGSVPNEEQHNLARISLRWMIRECFKLHCGIIFDAHMLMHEVGLDINSLSTAPDPLPPEIRQLGIPGDSFLSFLRRFSLLRIPSAVLRGLNLPLRWVKSELLNLLYYTPPEFEFAFTSAAGLFQYKGEAEEELKDALSPIYDQLNLHWYWKVMEWIPWIIRRQRAEMVDVHSFWAYKFVWNRGKGRTVYDLVARRGIKVHRSVKTRMLAPGLVGEGNYLPKIRFLIDGKARQLTRDEWLADKPQHFKWVD